MEEKTSFTGLSVCMPALNEEARLRESFHNIKEAAERLGIPLDVVIIDDGSLDSTGNIADLLASKYQNVTVVHNEKSLGRGEAFRKGLTLATYSHYMLLNGKNDTYISELSKLLSQFKKTPEKIVIAYQANLEERELGRKIASKAFTWLNNKFFALNLRYYNNPTVFPVRVLKDITLINNSYAFQAEAIVKCLSRKFAFIEVGVIDQLEEGRKTRGLNSKNIFGIVKHFVLTKRDTL